MDYLNLFLITVLMFLSFQYNFYIFSVLIVGIYSLFSKSKFNYILVFIYFLLYYNFIGIDFICIVSSIFLFLLILFSNLFQKKGESSDSSFDDLSKLLGGGGE